jgi:hypothetical protein
METLLTEIMISQGNCGQFALKAGTQLLLLGYHDDTPGSSVTSTQQQSKVTC